MSNHILIIEDNPEVRENTSELLTLAGYRVSEAIHGKEGIAKVNIEKPDLILCDIMMPVMDGYETLYLLSRNQETQNIPFIFLSAKAEKSDVREGMNLGADDYLTKPFEEMDLLKTIETRLKRKKIVESTPTLGSDIVSFYQLIEQKEIFQKWTSEHEIMTLNKKTMIYRSGDNSNSVYLLLEGQVRTFQINENGKELATATLNVGELFGHIEVLKGSYRSDYAESIIASKICRIPKTEFIGLLNQPDVAQSFIRHLTNDISHQQDQLMDLAYKSVCQRVIKNLLELYNPEDGLLDMSRTQFASVVGTSTESVIRVLRDLHNDEYIEIKGSKITVRNEDALKRFM